jgi:SAM-dependent methyltransferase
MSTPLQEVSDYARWKGWRPERFAVVKSRDAKYFDWHVRRAMGGRDERLKVLEIGFGNGAFLGWTRRRGHDVVGTEIDLTLCDLARSAGFRVGAAIDEVTDHAPWDLVVGFDVLEHVPSAELPGFLQVLASHLSPGGRMLFRFPNGESPFGLIRQFRDTTHVSILGVSRMRQVVMPLGLEVVCSGDALPWFAKRLRSAPTAFLGAVCRGLMQWTLGRLYLGQAPNLQANEIVVLARRQLGGQSD